MASKVLNIDHNIETNAQKITLRKLDTIHRHMNMCSTERQRYWGNMAKTLAEMAKSILV